MPKKLSKQLHKEANQLKQWYTCCEGLQNILEFYIRAETQLLVEPAGTYNPQQNTFTFFSIPEQNKRWNDAILTGRKEDIATLIMQIKQDLTRPEDRERKKLIHDNLVLHLQGKNSTQHAHYCLTEYLRYFYYRPQTEGIELHIHPHITTRITDEKGQRHTFEPEEGYSKADRKSSNYRPLGLIEFTHTIIEYNTLFIAFTIHHRVAEEEILIETPRIVAPLNGTPTSGKHHLTRKKYHQTEALQHLATSAHIRPLITYDEEDLQTYFKTELSLLAYEQHKQKAEELHKKTWGAAL